ncbi:MAG: transcription termination/antitermination protein NusA [Lachnospiraceae bacterium]|nr:transcription termination/antitermination protein NusA [Lachnospiraceae bacterium]
MAKSSGNNELILALDVLEKEKGINKEVIFEAIETSLVGAYKTNYDKEENVKVVMDRETGEFHVYSIKSVVEVPENPITEISLDDAREVDSKISVGEELYVEIQPRNFGRIAASNAKQTILQKIREEERRAIYSAFDDKEQDIVTGIVTKVTDRGITVKLGKVDALLTEKEQVPTEHFEVDDRIKVFITEIKKDANNAKGNRILISRTHYGLVKRLFEQEVTEIKDGIVVIKNIIREAGSRTKMAVYSTDPNVDPVGACVGVNGQRVNAVVEEINGEKIDIIEWNENPAIFIENALSPAKVVAVLADLDENSAVVIVPDFQLSLAIGKEGQNARLAARLTNFKIDIKSETQAKEAGIQYIFDDEDYYDDDEYYDDEEYYDEESDNEESEEGVDEDLETDEAEEVEE